MEHIRDDGDGAPARVNRASARVGAYKVMEKQFKKISSLAEAHELGAVDLHAQCNVDSTTTLLRCVDLFCFAEASSSAAPPTSANEVLGQLYSFNKSEGVYIITNALSRRHQLELCHSSLTEWLQRPHRTNLHAELDSRRSSENNNNSSSSNSNGKLNDSDTLPTSCGDDDDRCAVDADVQTLDRDIEACWEMEGCAMLPGRRDEECVRLPKDWTLSRLRWVTLGGQYDWTKRAYPPVGASPPFPSQLARLGSAIAEACGFTNPAFCAEAGIVNFYPEGAMMGGHRDDAESNYSCPVISISIGAPCVFLLGGLDRDTDTPTPIILHSGDILVFGGPSRLCVHGVPKVFLSVPSCAHRQGSVGEVSTKSSSKPPTTGVTEGPPAYLRSPSIVEASAASSSDERVHKYFVFNGLRDAGRRAACETGAGAPVEEAPYKKARTEAATGADGTDSEFLSQTQEQSLLKYLLSHRININVRQVY